MNTKPEAYHPSEYLREELESRGWTAQAFADESGLRLAAAEELIAGTRPWTRLMSLCVGNALGTSQQVWNNLHDSWKAGQSK